MLEKIHRHSIRERVRGGRMIWSEWHFGDPLRRLLKPGTRDYLEHHGIRLPSTEMVIAWHRYVDSDDESEESAHYWNEMDFDWHEFKTWEDAEAWFEDRQ